MGGVEVVPEDKNYEDRLWFLNPDGMQCPILEKLISFCYLFYVVPPLFCLKHFPPKSPEILRKF